MDNENKPQSRVDNLCVAMPCSFDWESMKGNDEIRLCSGCNKNVYNLSSMSKERAEDVLSATETHCVRIARNADGRMIHDDCPKWLKPLRNSWKKGVGIAVSFLALFSVAPQAKAQQSQPSQNKNLEQPKPNTVMPALAGVPIYIPRNQSVQGFWPTSISGLGFSKEDLPLSITEKFTAKQISEIDNKTVALDSIPPQLDKSGWELFFKGRKNHLKAAMYFVNKDLDKAMHESENALNNYQLALEQVSRGRHDEAFAALMYQEQNKIRQLEEQIRQCQSGLKKSK